MREEICFIVNRKGALKRGFRAVVLIVMMLSVLLAQYAFSGDVEGSIYDKVKAGNYIDTGLDKTKGISMDLVEKGLTHKVLEFEITSDIAAQEIQLLIAENNFDANSGSLSKLSTISKEEQVYESVCNPYNLEDPVNHSINRIDNCTSVQKGTKTVYEDQWLPVEMKASEKADAASLSTFNILEKGKYRYSFDTPIVNTGSGWGNAGTVFLKVGDDLFADKQHSSWWNLDLPYKRAIQINTSSEMILRYYTAEVSGFNTTDTSRFNLANRNNFAVVCNGQEVDKIIGNTTDLMLKHDTKLYPDSTGWGTANTTFLFRIPFNITGVNNTACEIYYGNLTYSSAKYNISNIALLYDNFELNNISDRVCGSSPRNVGNGWIGSADPKNGTYITDSCGTLNTSASWGQVQKGLDTGICLDCDKFEIDIGIAAETTANYQHDFWLPASLAFPAPQDPINDITRLAIRYLPYSYMNIQNQTDVFKSGGITPVGGIKMPVRFISLGKSTSGDWIAYRNSTYFSWATNYTHIFNNATIAGVWLHLNRDVNNLDYVMLKRYMDIPPTITLGGEILPNKAPIVSIYSLQPTAAYTADDLNCSFIVTDANTGDNLTANVSWYNGTSLYGMYAINVTNGTLASNILKAGNITKGETWNCSVIAYDGTAYSNASSAVRYINNTLPVITSYNASNATYTYSNTPNVNFSEGENITFAVEVSDADVAEGDTLWYSWFVDSAFQWLSQNSWFDWAFNFTSAGLHIVRVDANDSENAITNRTWYVTIANTVNKLWSVDYVTPPTPANNTNLTDHVVNISVLVTPSLIGTAEAKTIFHNATYFNDNGVHNLTEINATAKAVQLSYPYLLGSYTSNISYMGENVIWDNLSWAEFVPSDGELSQQNNLVGLWHMNNNWLDSSGYSNDGTAYGAVFTTEAKLGSHAGSFDGVDDYVSVPSTSGDELDLRSDMSVTAWIKWEGPSDPPDVYYPRIIEKDYQTSYMFSLRPDDATRLSVWLQNSERASTPSGSVSLNEWHYVAFTFNDISNEVKIYIDGAERGSGSYTGSISGNANNIYIGRYPGSAVAYFNGTIDEAAIWNRSLTAEEIQSIYNATAGGIKMQTRSCDDAECDTELFTGPTGTSSYYTNANYESLSNLQQNKYFQYKAFLETSDASVSPLLYNVTVKAHTLQAIENVSINNAWIDFNGSIYQMSGSGLSWSYANNTLGIGSYSYRVYVNDTFGNVNLTTERTFTVPSYIIYFNVTDGDTELGVNNINISSCNYNGFNQNGDDSNPYGPYTFSVGTWQCTFKDTAIKPQYWDKTLIFNVNEDKNISVVLSFKGGLSYEEHTQLDWLYNCWRYGECDAYGWVKGTYTNVSRIWQEFIPTNISVVANETFISKTLSPTSNITIDYKVNLPYKKGVEDKALLPIRIFYWFTNSSGVCFNQDKQTTPSNRAETPFCIPMMAEYLGPNNGTANFTVVLKPNLPYGTYEVVRQIDIDPPVDGIQTWINYGREVIGNINAENLLTEITPSTSENAFSNNVVAESPSLPNQGLNQISGASTVIPDGKFTYNGWFVTLWFIIISATIISSIYIKSRYK